MSQHPSFGGSAATSKHRSVLKRYEKLETLQKKGEWSEGATILGLPKIKVFKIKAKKKAVAKEDDKAAVKDTDKKAAK
ncbi:MAG: small basic protein (TIGR04137 family) [Candidatus Omnitrophota bacterium]|jgi:small basic protein (TIGR04137 family)